MSVLPSTVRTTAISPAGGVHAALGPGLEGWVGPAVAVGDGGMPPEPGDRGRRLSPMAAAATVMTAAPASFIGNDVDMRVLRRRARRRPCWESVGSSPRTV